MSAATYTSSASAVGDGEEARQTLRAAATRAWWWLGSGLVLLAIAMLSAGYGIGGMSGLWAALIACLLCAIPTLAAFYMVQLSPADKVLQVVLGGMLVRIFVPLVGGMILPSGLPWLGAAGLMNYVMAGYLTLLAMETAIVLPVVQAKQAPPSRASTTSSDSSNSATSGEAK